MQLDKMTNTTLLRLLGLALLVGAALTSVHNAVVSPDLGIAGAGLPVVLVLVLASLERSIKLGFGALLAALVLIALGLFEGASAATCALAIVASVFAAGALSVRTNSLWPLGLAVIAAGVASLVQYGLPGYSSLLLGAELIAGWGVTLATGLVLETRIGAREGRALGWLGLFGASGLAVFLLGPKVPVLFAISIAATLNAVLRFSDSGRSRALAPELVLVAAALVGASMTLWGAWGLVVACGASAMALVYLGERAGQAWGYSAGALLWVLQGLVWLGLEIERFGVPAQTIWVSLLVAGIGISAQMAWMSRVARRGPTWFSQSTLLASATSFFFVVTRCLPDVGPTWTICWLLGAVVLFLAARRQIALQILSGVLATAALVRFALVDWQQLPIGWTVTLVALVGGALLVAAEAARLRAPRSEP